LAQSGSSTKAASDKSAASKVNTVSSEERASGWRLLFDGQTTKGWRGFKQQTMPDGWQAADGTLARVNKAGDIITDEEFDSFELSIDWKISPGGNSGIFYRATEDVDPIYEGAPEYQVLDNTTHHDGQSPLTSAGSDYALYPPARDVTRPVGQWNVTRIIVNGNHVEHWMNGEKLLEYELGSADWKERVAKSKFATMPNYGKAARGHIGLQDHGDPVWYRNIKIRPLSSRTKS
jgi:hypothetical protein